MTEILPETPLGPDEIEICECGTYVFPAVSTETPDGTIVHFEAGRVPGGVWRPIDDEPVKVDGLAVPEMAARIGDGPAYQVHTVDRCETARTGTHR